MGCEDIETHFSVLLQKVLITSLHINTGYHLATLNAAASSRGIAIETEQKQNAHAMPNPIRKNPW